MSGPSRRDFLKKSAGLASGAAIAGSVGAAACTPDTPGAGGEGGQGPGARAGALPPAPLRALANAVLPVGALGADGMDEAVRDFSAWVDGFEPAAELDHPYLTGELLYGPPHPGPRWAAQLEAMELEAERRTGTAFSALSADARRSLAEEVIERADGAGLPGSPAAADHVVLGLMAWFYGTSKANDLCYDAEVGRHLCRGTPSLPQEPRPLEDR